MAEFLKHGLPMQVTIRRNADGVVRLFQKPELLWFHNYIWEYGNFSCDCNRATFFTEAGNEEDPDEDCGDTAYTVLEIKAAGKIVYKESPP